MKITSSRRKQRAEKRRAESDPPSLGRKRPSLQTVRLASHCCGAKGIEAVFPSQVIFALQQHHFVMLCPSIGQPHVRPATRRL
jgi:hypothetical protein